MKTGRNEREREREEVKEEERRSEIYSGEEVNDQWEKGREGWMNQ